MSSDKVDPSVDDNLSIRYAVQNNYPDIVRLLLLNNKVDPSVDDNCLVIYASANGYLDIVKLLLTSDKVDPATNDIKAFGWACQNGHLEIVKLLLETGKIDPSARNNAPIIGASQNGHIEIVKLLLSFDKVNPSDRNHKLSSLKLACINKHTQVVKLLLESGKIDQYHKIISLAISCEYGHDEIFELLLTNGNIDLSTQYNMTQTTFGKLIIDAVIYGRVKIFKLLLEFGIDILPQIMTDLSMIDTIIDIAVENNRTEIINLLINHYFESQNRPKNTVSGQLNKLQKLMNSIGIKSVLINEEKITIEKIFGINDTPTNEQIISQMVELMKENNIIRASIGKNLNIEFKSTQI